jgi:predicted helicase
MPLVIEPGHPALKEYYARLQGLDAVGATHEQATRIAFSTLLDAFSKNAGWTLVLEERLATGKRPDATLKDSLKLPRGYWEAKDIHDDLDAQIEAKKKIRYPLDNTIFENTRRAVLYQDGREVQRFDLTKPAQAAALLTRFFNHTREDFEGFHQAVAEFQNRIPQIAQAMQENIREAHESNAQFGRAFASFHDLCRQSLNPAISQAAIDEMLVQHLLTERLFRNVFNNPEFISRNVIASEIERVIGALTSRSFSRQEFLRYLDPFYNVIEETGSRIHDWSEKQDFLNAIYERFFQKYSVGQADTMGIVYTPQPIVDWMCQSVDKVLASEFGLSLSSRGVQILDPCTGTGNFLVNIIRRINRRDLEWKYENDLFCNEIMLLPYYIASMNIEHEYFEQAREYRTFEGICFADTLDLQEVNLFSEENTERIKKQKAAKLKVIIGNPPYNVGQKNENDNNKNRAYKDLDRRIRETYAKASKATLKSQLYDPYVRFFKWASERLGESGVVCYVSNNSFVDQHAFDGMRKYLLDDYDAIYHLDLHGNVRKNPKLSGTTHNVFGIQVGVGITIAIKNPKRVEKTLKYFRVPEMWKRSEKEAFLLQTEDVEGVEWQTLKPNAKNAWLTEGLQEDFESFLPMGSKAGKAVEVLDSEVIFRSYSRGVATSRDAWVFDFNSTSLEVKMRLLIDNYNLEVERWLARDKSKVIEVDSFVDNDSKKLKWDGTLKGHLSRGKKPKFNMASIRRSCYRPFTKQFLYFDSLLNNSQYLQQRFFPNDDIDNQLICVSGPGNDIFYSLISQHIPELKFANSTNGGSQCFPLYTYSSDGKNRTENITDWALQQFRLKYLPEVSKCDIFHYVYALLHHPQYRERYAENLKRELPRIPLVGDADLFQVLARTGEELSRLHLGFESAPEFALRWVENREVPWTWRVEKMKLSSDKTSLRVNEALTLEDIPPQALEYRLGNRSALEWVVDQFQVKSDARSGLGSDPNRADEPEYIARLVCRVVHVSVETVRLVRAMPGLEFAASST